MVSGFQSEARTDLDLISHGHLSHLVPAELGAVATSALESHRRSAMSSKVWGSYCLYKIHQVSSCRVPGDKEQLNTFKENILTFGWQPSLSTERSKWLSTVRENMMSSPWDAWRKVVLSWHSSSYCAMTGGDGWGTAGRYGAGMWTRVAALLWNLQGAQSARLLQLCWLLQNA